MEYVDEAPPHIAGMSCYTCQNRNGIVDTGVHVEGEGVLGLCITHILEMAGAAGYELMDSDVHDELEQTEKELDAAKDEIARLESFIKTLVNEASRIASKDEEPDSDES